jgi:hypothetical protein
MMVSSTWFNASFKYRIRYSQTASCTGTITTTNPGRYLAIDYPVITSGNQMIPCGISFINMCGYGPDNNDDGVGSSSTSMTTVFGTTRRSPNNAERGVEILTSQTSAYASQNLSGSTFATNYDLCNAEGGDKQCINWQSSNNFYSAVYEAIMDFERPNINLQYYKGTTAQSTTLTKVTTAGKTPTVGWRYSGSRIVSCGSTSDLNPGCNGYSFQTPSLPTQFIRAFYQLAVNSTGNSWSFYGPTSCSNYFNGPFFSPTAVPDTISGESGFVTCNPDPVFMGNVNYCSDDAGFTGSSTLTITGPNGFSETINSGAIGTTVIADTGTYTITPNLSSSPAQCLSCARSICVNVTSSDLINCSILPIELVSFSGQELMNKIRLDWITQTETNNDHFIVEKSFDAINFNSIGNVDGVGTSSIQRKYVFYDNSFPMNSAYYRLRQVDFNGAETLSRTIYLNASKGSIVLFPNPNKGLFSLSSDGFNGFIRIKNILGEIVFEKHLSKGEYFDIDISGLASGIYQVYSSSDATLPAQKMIIYH